MGHKAIFLMGTMDKEKNWLERGFNHRGIEAFKKIILCRDCSDSNTVMNTAQRLIEKGYVKSRFSKGRFYWSLKKDLAGGD
jgi:hypothetical protein